nr:hypothetical protein [Tanacetum cinerariifolium]
MSEEDQAIDVVALPKFNMSSYESSMSTKDVKSLALRHGIPLDLHLVALTKGWTMDQLSDDMIGLYEQYFKFSRIRSGKGARGQIFRKTLSRLKRWKKKIFFLDRRAIPDAMAWRHHDSDISDSVPEDGFSKQDVQTLAERVIDLCLVPSGLLFQGGLATTWDFPGFRPVFKDTEGNEKGNVVTNQDLRAQHTVPPLSAGQAILDKTDHQKEVEIADPKIVPQLRKKPVLPLRKGRRKRGVPTRERVLVLKEKEKKFAAQKDSSATSEHVSSPEPIRMADPADPNMENPSKGAANIAKCSKPLRAIIACTVALPPRGRPPTLGFLLKVLMAIRVGGLEIKPIPAQEESIALENSTTLERAWFALGRGALAQADMLKRFKNLQADYNSLAETHADYGDTVQLLEGQKSELSQVNKDQALKIKELEDTLARKYSALVYAERINAERAQEKKRLVAQLGKSEKKKFDCIRKLLPTVVEHLFQSYEYKQSLSEPFNLAIQTGRGEGLTEERSKEELLSLMSRMENFDAYADKKMRVEYDKLFEKRYPYVEKVSCGFCHTVSALLKVYPDFPPSEQAPPNNPFSGKAPSSAPGKT